MAHFSSPCQKSVLIKTDAAPMPTLTLSTYLTDYISPSLRKALAARLLIAAQPPDCLPEDAGMRLLPTRFRDVYRNCVSASIGDRLELQFTDDTPQWKRDNRAAAAAWWIRPLEERRQFVETQNWNMRGGGAASGGSGDGGGVAAGTGDVGGEGFAEMLAPGDGDGEIVAVQEGVVNMNYEQSGAGAGAGGCGGQQGGHYVCGQPALGNIPCHGGAC